MEEAALIGALTPLGARNSRVTEALPIQSKNPKRANREVPLPGTIAMPKSHASYSNDRCQAHPRMALRSQELDEINEFMTSVRSKVCYKALRRGSISVDTNGAKLLHSNVFTGSLTGVGIHMGEQSMMAVSFVRRGQITARQGSSELVVEAGMVHITHPGTEVDLSLRDCDVLVLNIERALIEQTAIGGSKLFPHPYQHQSLDTRHSKWIDLLEYGTFLHNCTSRVGSMVHQPRLSARVEETMVDMLGECLRPDEVLTGDCRGSASQRRVLRIAENHMHAKLGTERIDTAELAARGRVSMRTINRAFRDVYGMSAREYERELRLRAAAKMLRDGEAGHVTVANVALHYGFQHLGRFSLAYKRSFGESPSQTLRTRTLRSDPK